MSKRAMYADTLRQTPRGAWPEYLTEHSGLPGPRANLELMQAVADVGDQGDFDALISGGDEYLVCCGVVGLGALLAAAADEQLVTRLRTHASDERWRVREAVAMALQRLSDADPARLAT
ncbi:MAG: HEAT repeat domain-containing protein, partial [Microbacterium sp.]